MADFDMTLALTIAFGGLGVVFIILIILALAILGIKKVSERLDQANGKTPEKGA